MSWWIAFFSELVIDKSQCSAYGGDVTFGRSLLVGVGPVQRRLVQRQQRIVFGHFLL